MVLLLATLALWDRRRGPRLVHGEDPRAAFAVGGLLLAWCSLGPTPIPGTGLVVESPLLTFGPYIPGVNAVRALGAIAIGTGIATSFLAGYGALVLLERQRGRRFGSAFAVGACALALLSCRFVPPVAHFFFDRSFQITSFTARPPQQEIDLIHDVGRGPLIDYPLAAYRRNTKRLDIADSLLLASYAPRPMAACYNSFLGPPNEQVITLSADLPSVAAAEALGALGFDTLMLHRRRSGPFNARAFERRQSADPEIARRLRPLGNTPLLQAYRISPRDPITSDFSALGPAEDLDSMKGLFPRIKIPLTIQNHSEMTFRHPEPLEPSDLALRWRDTEGRLVHESAHRLLLPIALAAGAKIPLVIPSTTPDRVGDHTVSLESRRDPKQVFATRQVHLENLEAVKTPAEIAFHLHHAFLKGPELMRLGFRPFAPPSDEIEFVLHPDVPDLATLQRMSPLDAHWLEYLGTRMHTTRIAGKLEPGSHPRLVKIRMPTPGSYTAHTIVLTPANQPRTAVAASLVYPGGKAIPPQTPAPLPPKP